MTEALRALVSKADGIPEKVLLWINVGLACFVALAHGGALALTYSKPAPDAESIRQLAMFSLPIAALVIVTAVAALIRTALARRVLGIHGFVLIGSAGALLLWALGILLKGIPEGNFSWSVGLLSTWVCYSVFVLCRFSLPTHLRGNAVAFYAPVIALVFAAIIDIGIFIRLVSGIGGESNLVILSQQPSVLARETTSLTSTEAMKVIGESTSLCFALRGDIPLQSSKAMDQVFGAAMQGAKVKVEVVLTNGDRVLLHQPMLAWSKYGKIIKNDELSACASTCKEELPVGAQVSKIEVSSVPNLSVRGIYWQSEKSPLEKFNQENTTASAPRQSSKCGAG